MSEIQEIQSIIEKKYEAKDAGEFEHPEVKSAIRQTISYLNEGKLRIASQKGIGKWVVHTWLKKAILLYFRTSPMASISSGDLQYHDCIPPRIDYQKIGVRVVPPAVCRYGAHIEKGAILMPSYVNIGAYVSTGTMVDTWATVGSCAQIGAQVHLSGGVGIGGVLEPPQAQPVIIEDHAFLGSRAIVVEGVIVEEGAVLGANVVLTASTPIIDVTNQNEVIYKGRVPAHSVVIPGSRVKPFPAGEYGTPVALIIGQRKESTDKKTSLEMALRDFQVSA